MDIVPKFVEWSKQGEVGRRKLNQATRWLTIVLGFVQSIGITAGFNALSTIKLVNNPGMKTYLTIGLILTAGTMFATWMGDMITHNCKSVSFRSRLIIYLITFLDPLPVY